VGASGAERFKQDPYGRRCIAAVTHREGIPVDDDCGKGLLKCRGTMTSLAGSLGRWRTRARRFPMIADRVHHIIMGGCNTLD
jgi:hypothetical protein